MEFLLLMEFYTLNVNWKPSAAAAAGTLITSLANPILGILTSGAIFTGGIVASLIERKIDLDNKLRNYREIAYIYDIKKQLV